MLCHNMLSNISEALVFFIAQNRPHGIKTVAGISLETEKNSVKRYAGKEKNEIRGITGKGPVRTGQGGH